MENGLFEHIVPHLEKDLELNSVEALDELQMNSMTQREQTDGNKDNSGTINSDTNNSNPKNNKNDKTSKTVCLPCGTCGNTIHQQRNVTMEPMQQTGHFPGSTERTSSTKRTEQYNQECHSCGPCFELDLPRLYSETACDRLETNKLIKLSPIPEVAWQQPPEISMDNFNLNNIDNIAATVTTQTAHITEPRHKTVVELQRWSLKRILPQNSGTATERF